MKEYKVYADFRELASMTVFANSKKEAIHLARIICQRTDILDNAVLDPTLADFRAHEADEDYETDGAFCSGDCFSCSDDSFCPISYYARHDHYATRDDDGDEDFNPHERLFDELY